MPSRRGSAAHLKRDLRQIILKAADQAERLRNLIHTNQGIWKEDGTWLDMSEVREIYTIVVSLDEFGPAVLDIESLVQGGILPQSNLPWIICVHDLIVFADIINRPEQFLAYLRRRTNRDAALWITATDELDIMMWFIDGGFYFTLDPDRLYQEFPHSRKPAAKERREYANQGRTVVGTFTDPLDAWYYYHQELSSTIAEKPVRECNEFFRYIIDKMRDVASLGWLRCGADLDNYAEKAQEEIARRVQEILRLYSRDGQFHTFATSGIDDIGPWTIIFATGTNSVENLQRLETYIKAKKHQSQASRAMAFWLEGTGELRRTIWLDDPPAIDQELDILVRQMRLVPLNRIPRVIPPKAKKPSNNARRKKHRKR